MPRVGVEAERRRALIEGVIAAAGERGSLDVTVREIAARAGVSSALAHHYFGAKEDLILAALRHMLTELGLEVRTAVRKASAKGGGPRERLSAILAANFSPAQFEPRLVSAWLAFYVLAQESGEAHRLLRIYAPPPAEQSRRRPSGPLR